MNNFAQDITFKSLLNDLENHFDGSQNLRMKALAYDDDLLNYLLANDVLKNTFFKVITANNFVFLKDEFLKFINLRLLSNSYTACANYIGLSFEKKQEKFIKTDGDVVLNFPFKDGVIKGGQTKDEQKINEVFLNNILAKDEIDVLFTPKVISHFELISQQNSNQNSNQNSDYENLLQVLQTENPNLLIKANNFIALHTLKYYLQQRKQKVKLIYIDPPYNTGNDSFNYNDKFNHSTWLCFMKNRLEIAKQLLSDDGVIFIQCDDNEQAYLKVLCDEIFGRENFVANIVNQSANSVFGTKAAHKDKNFLKVKDYVLVYKSKNDITINPLYTVSKSYLYDSHEFILDNQIRYSTTEWFEKNYSDIFNKYSLKINKKNIQKLMEFDESFRKEVVNKLLDIQFSTSPYSKNDLDENELNDLASGKIIEHNNIKLVQEGNGGLIRFLRSLRESCKFINNEYIKVDILGDVWNTSSGYGNINSEGNISFKNAKKPEILLKQIIESTTNENDLVLDFFAGSGTTLAVAHKMKRRYIGIEQMDYIQTITKQRLAKVIDGEQGGISKSINWQGGGNFVYIELAELNAKFKQKINAVNDYNEFMLLAKNLDSKAFLNYKLDNKNITEIISSDEFKNLNLDKQKQMLIACLDANMDYIPLVEIDDENYKFDAQVKQLNNAFYKINN